MTGISYKTSAMITRLWHVTIVFMLLSVCTNSDETNDFNNKKPLVNTTESPVVDVTTESPLISHVNITAVTGKYTVYIALIMCLIMCIDVA